MLNRSGTSIELCKYQFIMYTGAQMFLFNAVVISIIKVYVKLILLAK